MPPEDAAPATPEATPAPAAPAPVETREAKLERQIAKAVAPLEQSEPDAPAADAAPAPASKTPPKGPDGKFLPRSKAAKATAEAKPPTPDKATADPPAAPTSDDAPPSLPEEAASPRALFKAGKFEEAFKAAFGEDVNPQHYKIDSKQWAAFREKSRKVSERFQAQERQIETKAQQLVQTYEPIVKAKQAYDAGDLDTFVKVITGGECDASEFSRRLLHARYSKDPHTERLEREVRELREERERERREATEAQTRAQQQAEQRAYIEGVQSQLGESTDPRVVAAVSRERTRDIFLGHVFEIQREHWDPVAQITLPLHEAAEMALERLYSVHNEWAPVFGSGTPEPKPANTVQARSTPASPGAPRSVPRTLRQNEAAEANSPGRKLSQEEILSKYERELKLVQMG